MKLGNYVFVYVLTVESYFLLGKSFLATDTLTACVVSLKLWHVYVSVFSVEDSVCAVVYVLMLMLMQML